MEQYVRDQLPRMLAYPILALMHSCPAPTDRCSSLQKTGFRYLKNWLNVPVDQRENQSPLVLIYDETADRVTAKFAEKELDPSAPRVYS